MSVYGASQFVTTMTATAACVTEPKKILNWLSYPWRLSSTTWTRLMLAASCTLRPSPSGAFSSPTALRSCSKLGWWSTLSFLWGDRRMLIWKFLFWQIDLLYQFNQLHRGWYTERTSQAGPIFSSFYPIICQYSMENYLHIRCRKPIPPIHNNKTLKVCLSFCLLIYALCNQKKS